MNFKKLVSLTVIIGQMTLVAGIASADQGTTANSSPERILLTQVAALDGQGMSKSEYKSAVNADVQAYLISTPSEDKDARINSMKEALISRGDLPRDRADHLVAVLNTELSQSSDTSSKAVTAMVSNAVSNGLQLSNCNFDRGLGVLLVAGGVIAIPFIHKFGTADLSTFARNWTYVGAAAGIVTGSTMLYLNRSCN